MKIMIAGCAAALLATAALAQAHPGGITGPGQVAPDSRDFRTVDQHMNHGAPAYHGRQVCRVVHKHGHSYRRCKTR